MQVMPTARLWFDRFLKGQPNGIDRPPLVELAPDPWTGQLFAYPGLPARRTVKLVFRGRRTIGSSGKVARTRPRLKRARMKSRKYSSGMEASPPRAPTRTMLAVIGLPVERASSSTLISWFGSWNS